MTRHFMDINNDIIGRCDHIISDHGNASQDHNTTTFHKQIFKILRNMKC